MTPKKIALLLILFLLVFSNCKNKDKSIDLTKSTNISKLKYDYRDSLQGQFSLTIISRDWITGGYDSVDTIYRNGIINKNIGCSGFRSDKYRKIKIQYDSLENCFDNLFFWGTTIHVPKGYLYPTVDTLGHLTYPELMTGYPSIGRTFWGHIDKDSIFCIYIAYNILGGFQRTIYGKRINAS